MDDHFEKSEIASTQLCLFNRTDD